MKNNNEFIFIDFEMDVNCDSNPEQIISIGAIKTDNKGKILDTFFTYSKLRNKKHLYRYTTYLTGITDNDLNNAPYFNENLIKLEKFLQNNKNIYNWGWSDIKSLKKTNRINKTFRNKKINKINNFIIRNMKDYRDFLPKKYRKYKDENLFKIAKELKIIPSEYIQKHEALEDAIILKEIFFNIEEV